ncbi:MAG: hypothetical protein LBK50_00960 [Candidatus Nomurabacteria bacterium]|nr:hypothetical protein [Candidatus Nomurabacteria bacterium]
MAEAVGRANAILVAAEREATEVERLAAIRAAEMALIANPPRRITVPVAWEEFCGYGYGNFNRDVCQDVTIEMATREVVDATVPKWSSSALSKHKLRDVLKVGDVLPADSREWGRALGL